MSLQMRDGRGREPVGLRAGEEPEEDKSVKAGKKKKKNKWVKHYSSKHHILLVGEGDFSFSLCLARSFGSALNIVASSLDSHDDVVKKYKMGMSNLKDLQRLGACVLHGVDATRMKFHPELKTRVFDRIIFNFPHAGFHGREDSFFLIQEHKNLVHGFFMNARSMLIFDGEIHVSHKTTPPFSYWCIEELGIQSFLWPIDSVDFKKEDYPGYNNKRGAGSRCDKPFPLGECCTFKFSMFMKKQSHTRKQRNLSNHDYPLRSLIPQPPFVISSTNGYPPIFGGGGYSNSELGTLGRAASGYVGGISSELQRSLWSESTDFRHPQTEYVRDVSMILGRPVSGYVDGVSSELQSDWAESTEFRYPQTEYVRNMDMILRRPGSGYLHGIGSELQRSPSPEPTDGLVKKKKKKKRTN